MCVGEKRGGRGSVRGPLAQEEREALKKRFLREITQEHVECSGEEEGEWEGREGFEDTARELQFDSEERDEPSRKHHRVSSWEMHG